MKPLRSIQNGFVLTLIVFCCLAMLQLSGCSKAGSNVAGTYELDKESIKAAMQAEIDKIEDPAEKMGAGMMMGMIDALNMTMTLNDDGSATLKMEGMGEMSEATGTWTVNGNQITVTAAEEGEEPEPANGTIDGDTITLSLENNDSDMPFDLVFKKKQ